MNNIQRLRQKLAEIGCEFTVKEIAKTIAIGNPLFANLTYEDFLHYKRLTDENIRALATASGEDYKIKKNFVQIVIGIGMLKFECE